MKIVRGVEPKHILELNLVACGESFISGSLENISDGIKPTDGFHAVNDREEVIGWAAMFKGNDTHFFVKPGYRGQGIGKQLYKHCLEKNPNIRVFPWDVRSRRFFEAVDAKSAPGW